MIKKNSQLGTALYQKKPWSDNQNSIWLASTLNLQRNIEKFPLPAKLEKERQQQIISLLSKIVLNSSHLKKPLMMKSEELTPTQREYLFEHFLSPQSFLQAHSGEAFILDQTGQFLTTLNINNHLNFQLIDCKGELETAWNRLIKMEIELGKAINYAFCQKFGFLTQNPACSGTGFILTLFIQPSALIHSNRIEEVLKNIQTETIAITGLQGTPDEIIGDVLAVKNNYTLGITEENIISTLRIFATKLILEENTLRNHLKENPDPALMDKVSRAYGVLIHSYQIEPIEALNAISLIKLGADLGWLKGASPLELNRLFFDCRRAHLLSQYKQAPEIEEIPHKRAEFIHQTLKKAKLTI